MNILFRAHFCPKLSESLLGSGSGSTRFQKSDQDPVKNRPDPKHCFPVTVTLIVLNVIFALTTAKQIT
jgi:hypothetical protein